MKDALQQLLAPPGLEATSFPPTSRYHGIGVRTFETVSGQEKVYLKRRFVPPPEAFSLLQIHRVSQGERIDHLAHLYLGNPEQYWQLCDANGAVRPDELTEEVGRELRITLPKGFLGGSNA